MTTPQQAVSRKQENRTAHVFGGTLQPGSGSGWVHRNDVKTDDLLIENKTKVNPRARSISIAAKDLEQLRVNALRAKRTGILGFALNTRHYVILTEDDFISYHDERWRDQTHGCTCSGGCSSSSEERKSGRSSTEGSAAEPRSYSTYSYTTAMMMLSDLLRKLSVEAQRTVDRAR